MPTIKEMCETIEKANLFKEPKTAKEIFEYSPSGELFEIFGWYAEARIKLGEPADKVISEMFGTKI
jgi:hypothetical protein